MQGSPRIDELRQKFHENPRRYFAPLANEYRKAGDPEQAIAICRAHLAQQPGHMSGHVVYGQALYDARRSDEARVVFEKALSLDPDNAIVLRHLGDIARERGDATEARHWYGKALDVDPQDSEVAAYVAELAEPVAGEPDAGEPDASGEIASAEGAESSGEVEASDEVAWRKTPKSEESPFVTRTMADLYAQQGYREAALDIFRQLAIRQPDDAEIRERIDELSEKSEPVIEPMIEPMIEPVIEPAVEMESEAEPPSDDEKHFTEIELTPGDSWDTDSWAAGFTPDEPGNIEFSSPDMAETASSARAGDAGVVAYSPEPPSDDELAHFTPPASTVREFFAALGARRPPSRAAAQSFTARAAIPGGEPDSSADAFANLFPDDTVGEDDTRAAFALSGAVTTTAHTPVPAKIHGTPPRAQPETSAPAPDQESDEDIRRFREWLDGLAES